LVEQVQATVNVADDVDSPVGSDVSQAFSLLFALRISTVRSSQTLIQPYRAKLDGQIDAYSSIRDNLTWFRKSVGRPTSEPAGWPATNLFNLRPIHPMVDPGLQKKQQLFELRVAENGGERKGSADDGVR